MAECPECGKAAQLRFAPFCSGRCQQIDLGRWLKGDFRIPGRDGEAGGQPDRSGGQAPEKDEE